MLLRFTYDSTALFYSFRININKKYKRTFFIIGLLKQTEYIVANGQFRPKITWFSIAAKVLGNMPYLYRF